MCSLTQSNLRWLSNADDVATFKTMLKIGLPITPTSQLQTPPIILFAIFKAIELNGIEIYGAEELEN